VRVGQEFEADHLAIKFIECDADMLMSYSTSEGVVKEYNG
jgi:hypothetical protein